MEDLFKSLIWDTVVDIAMKKLVAKIPILAFGPINFIATFIITEFLDGLYSTLDKFFDMQAFPVKNTELRKEFDLASLKLKLIANSSGIDSNEYKEGKNNAKTRLSKFVKFDIN